MASDSPWGTIAARTPTSRRRLGLAAVATALVAGLVVLLVATDLFTVPEGTTDVARGLLADYGLAALFVVFVIEGAMLLYFAPSESLVPAAVVVLTDSVAEVGLVLAVAVAGATIGQVALFVLARRGGREYLLEKRWFRVQPATLDRFDAWFQRWGPLAVPVSNTLPFTRGMLTIPAGLSEMNARTFAVLSAFGTLAFEAILAGLTLGLLEAV